MVDGFLGFRPGCKVWLEKEGAVFGEGLYRLLLGIDRAGSIAAAAMEMGMSYRAAWGKIRAAEKRWRISLVITRVGGEAGGGARLTGEARMLVERFRELQHETESLVKHFYSKL